MLTRIKKKRIFKPSIKIVTRVLKGISAHGSILRTELAKTANVNYSILSNYLAWLEEKCFVELIILDKKIHVRLTERGRDVILHLDKLNDELINLVDSL